MPDMIAIMRYENDELPITSPKDFELHIIDLQVAEHVCESKEILGPHQRSALGNGHEGGGGDKVGPAGPNTDQRPLVVVEVDRVHPPANPALNDLELSIEQWMERMGDAEGREDYFRGRSIWSPVL